MRTIFKIIFWPNENLTGKSNIIIQIITHQ